MQQEGLQKSFNFSVLFLRPFISVCNEDVVSPELGESRLHLWPVIIESFRFHQRGGRPSWLRS